MTISVVFEQGNVSPRIVRITTTSTLAQVTASGWYKNVAPNQLVPSDEVEIAYAQGSSSAATSLFDVAIVAGVVTLTLGDTGVILPVVSGDFAVFSGTSGAIADLGYLPSDAAKTRVVMAGSAVVSNRIAHFIDTTGTIDDTAAAVTNAGDIYAGLDAVAGVLRSYPATTATGYLGLTAVSNSGAFNTIISNAAMGQTSTISIPNPGATTANFLLDTGAANIIAEQQFVGISNVLTFGTGTWTVTRIAQGDYVSRHTAGDETSIIAVDITPIIRVAAAKGFRLDSFDYIYSIGTLAMDAHSLTLDRIAYANNVAVSVTSVPITATLATATQANPYVTNCTVTTPAFDITADSKYVIEITANNSATSAYDFYGVMLRFSQTIG